MAIGQTRATTLMLGLISVPVRLTSVEDKAPAPSNYCTKDHYPEKVKQSLACPKCDNTDRAYFKRGVTVGTTVELLDEEPKADVNHKTCTLTRHSKAVINELSMTAGSTYYVLPDAKVNSKAVELYATFRDLIEDDPESSFVTTWGWTTLKTNMWVFDVQLGNILMRQMLWPEDVRHVDAPEGLGNEEARQLLNLLVKTSEFHPEDYQNINAKAAREALARARTATVTNTNAASDLVSVLQAALLEQEMT